jgi:hypothetical protein
LSDQLGTFAEIVDIVAVDWSRDEVERGVDFFGHLGV